MEAVINDMHTTKGDIVTDPTAITDVFKKIFETIFTHQNVMDMKKCASFLKIFKNTD